MKSGLIDPYSMVGQTMTDHEGSFVVENDRAERVKLATDYIGKRLATLNGEVKLYAERKVDPAYLVGRADMKGTVDVTIIAPLHRVVEIIDFKDGMDPVDAVGNEQMEIYALGVLAECQTPVNMPYPYDTVTMTIIQPKMRVKNLPPITSDTVTVQHLLGIVGQVVVEANATDQSDAPFAPGEKQCKYCTAKGQCAAQAKASLEGVGIMFPAITQQMELPPFMMAAQPAAMVGGVEAQVLDMVQQSAEKDPTKMTNDQLAQIKEAAPLLRQLLESVDEEILSRLKKGQAVKGFKVVNGRGARAWALPEDEMEKKLIGMGIPKAAIYETKMVSPAKAEKLVWEKTTKGETVRKSLSEHQLKMLEKEYIVTTAGAMTVAPETDSRPAVTLDASPLFSAVEQQPALPASLADVPDWMK